MLTLGRPGTGGNARGLLAKVSPVRGWPTRRSVNNCQGWRALGDSAMELFLMEITRQGRFECYPQSARASNRIDI